MDFPELPPGVYDAGSSEWEQAHAAAMSRLRACRAFSVTTLDPGGGMTHLAMIRPDDADSPREAWAATGAFLQITEDLAATDLAAIKQVPPPAE